MKLHIENDFPCDPATVWQTFDDPAFEARLEDSSGVVYETLSTGTEGEIEVRRIKCTAKKELPRVLQKALGSDRLSYTQVNRLDRAANQLDWEVIPMALADKVTARGTTRVEARDGGSHRTVHGDIEVRLPLIGPRIEKLIVDEVRSSYVRAAEVALEMITAKTGSG